jgi:hypothetical protein
VLTSTNRRADAWRSDKGAIFSDYLLASLAQGDTLYSGFQSARWAVTSAHPVQKPWLDADGDGIPNETEDETLAAQRGFGYAGTLDDDTWPPYIVQVEEPATITQGKGIIRAEVRDDVKVRQVRAAIYPPSYEPPETEDELINEVIETLVLNDQGNNWYGVTYSGFDEAGTYRVVFYANDNEDLEAHPVDIEVIVEQATPTPTETATHTPTATPTATPTSDRVFLPLVVR